VANQEKQTGDQPAPTQKLGQPVQIEGRSPVFKTLFVTPI